MSLPTDELKILLEKGLGVPGLQVQTMRTSSCTNPGDNFMSVVSAVEVEGTLPGGSPYSQSVFVKWPVGGAERSQSYRVLEAFSNEATVYLRVLPLYGGTTPCPRCYHASSDLIVLEDLKREGYALGVRSAGFDQSTAGDALKALARFHAGSYHAKLTKEKEFLAATNQLKPVGTFHSSSRDMVETSLRRAIELVTGAGDIEDVLPVLRSFQGRVFEMMTDLRRVDRIAVMVHGDFWLNNLMLREGSNEPVKIVDLQACSVASPAVDVWTFLYTTVAPSIMESELFDQLLQLYSQSFQDNLTDLKIPPDRIPPSSEILHELKSKELYGLFIGTVYLPALDLSSTLPDLDSVTEEQCLSDDFALQFFGPELKNRILRMVRFCKKRGVVRR